MNVLVVSEGKHELGTDVESSALITLVSRILGNGPQFTLENVRKPEFRIHKPRGKSAAYEKRALACLRYAEREGFDALVFLVDEDGETERRTGIDNAQQHGSFWLPRAFGLAVRTFDAWMLADDVAMSAVLQSTIPLQKHPEAMKDPKRQVQRILDDAKSSLRLHEFYYAIAQTIDTDRLCKRCPSGYAPFHKRIEAICEI